MNETKTEIESLVVNIGEVPNNIRAISKKAQELGKKEFVQTVVYKKTPLPVSNLLSIEEYETNEHMASSCGRCHKSDAEDYKPRVITTKEKWFIIPVYAFINRHDWAYKLYKKLFRRNNGAR